MWVCLELKLIYDICNIIYSKRKNHFSSYLVEFQEF